MSIIGPAGEREMASAGILNLDKDGFPSRINARGGLGAVMGSKGLKAIVFDAAGGSKPTLVDAEAFRATQKVYNKFLMDHPQTHTYSDYGTPAMVHMADGLGGLPTRNFSSGTFEYADDISGEHLRELILERGGEGNPTHACMPGCIIRCSNVFAGEDGKTIVSPIEYETVGLMGSNLGIREFDMIGRLNWQANDLGICSIELGAALGVAAEAGFMQWGDGQAALELCDEIRGAINSVAAASNVPEQEPRVLSEREFQTIEDELVTLAVHINRATYRMLCLIRELDVCQAPMAVGFSSTAHYLNWRLGFDMVTAREKVRVARALASLPLTSAALERDASVTPRPVRSLESQLRRRKTCWFRLPRAGRQLMSNRWCASTGAPNVRKTSWTKSSRSAAICTCTLIATACSSSRVALPPEDGAIVAKALEAAQEVIWKAARHDSAESSVTVPQKHADALGILARAALAGGLDTSAAGEKPSTVDRSRFEVVVHVDAEVLADPKAEGRCEIRRRPGRSRGIAASRLLRFGARYHDARPKWRGTRCRSQDARHSGGYAPGISRKGPRLSISWLRQNPFCRRPSHQTLGRRW